MPTKSKSKSKTPTKAAFCKSFPWTQDIEWFDLTGLTLLPRSRKARIQLAMGNIHDHYVGFSVTLMSDAGEYAHKMFRFDDYLDTGNRADSRTDFIPHDLTYKVVGHSGWEWYIAEPKTTKPIVAAIERYIEMMAE